jgi:hypothetical protein
LAAWLTPAMFEETSFVLSAVCWTLRAISAVAVPCSSTAEAMFVAIALIYSIVVVIPLIACTAPAVALWTCVI